MNNISSQRNSTVEVVHEKRWNQPSKPIRRPALGEVSNTVKARSTASATTAVKQQSSQIQTSQRPALGNVNANRIKPGNGKISSSIPKQSSSFGGFGLGLNQPKSTSQIYFEPKDFHEVSEIILSNNEYESLVEDENYPEPEQMYSDNHSDNNYLLLDPEHQEMINNVIRGDIDIEFPEIAHVELTPALEIKVSEDEDEEED